MVTSCFFCQNQLSDFIEGVLPSNRQTELKRHIDTCNECTEVRNDLVATLEVLHGLPSQTLSHDMALKITEASQAGRERFFSRRRVSTAALVVAVPLLVTATLATTFPQVFPWLSRFRSQRDESHFVRYFPLLQGAGEILEEQSSWLHMREPFMLSVWEEGGLSPEEFEKSFQVKSTTKSDGK